MDEAERLCSQLAIVDHGRLIATGSPAELIARHIEPQVVEVFGEERRSGAGKWAPATAERCELSGETVFCYDHQPQPLIEALRQSPALVPPAPASQSGRRVLKLTGRELRD